jgi:hypothetical protein
MATLKIILSELVRTGRQESAAVKVTGAPKGSQVEVTLSQAQGKEPLWGPKTVTGMADTTGVAFVIFDLTFIGPSATACIKVTARDATGTYYEPDAHSFEVLP